MKRALFVFNAKAGKATIGAYLLDVFRKLSELDWLPTVFLTKYSGHASDIIRENGKDYDVILASGGDGTLNEVVRGDLELEKPIPIAYIPSGTVNDFASSMGIPKDIEDCLKKIEEQDTFCVDIGYLENRPFVYVAAFGTPVKVAYTTSQNEKNIWGYSAYVVNVLKELPHTKKYHLKITNHGETIEDDFSFGFITNSYSVSGFHGITGKDVSLNDGLFEVTLIRSLKLPNEIHGTLKSILTDEPDEEYMYRFRTDDIRIECDEEIEWCIDGEFGGLYKDSHIKVLKNAITFIV